MARIHVGDTVRPKEDGWPDVIDSDYTVIEKAGSGLFRIATGESDERPRFYAYELRKVEVENDQD